MPLLDRIRKHPYPVAACVGALVGVVVGLFLPIRAAAPTKAQEDVWVLPDAATVARFKQREYQQVHSSSAWGGLTTGRRERSVEWKLLAIVTQPSPQVAVVVGNDKPVWVKPGGSLPDGSLVTGIDRNTVRYEKDGCNVLRKLYATGKSETEEACVDLQEEPAAATTPTSPQRGATSPAPLNSESKSQP